jgi:hypothetical protein
VGIVAELPEVFALGGLPCVDRMLKFREVAELLIPYRGSKTLTPMLTSTLTL